MRTVINNKKEITVEDLVESLHDNTGSKRIVFYMSQGSTDNESYPVFLKKLSNDNYAFIAPIFSYNGTYQNTTIRESIIAAISGGKKLLVLEREEVSQLFKKIN